MTYEEKQKRFEELVMEAFRTAIDEKLIGDEEEPDVAMVVDWVIVADTIDIEGEPGTAQLHPVEQRLPEAYKLLSIAKLRSEEDIREWIRGDDL